jgi:hypothetical protein
LEDFFGAFADKYCADEKLKALGGPAFKSFGVEINSFGGETTGVSDKRPRDPTYQDSSDVFYSFLSVAQKSRH